MQIQLQDIGSREGRIGLVPLCMAGVLGALACVLYLPTLGGELSYDARAQILHDSYIHTPANLVKVVTLQCLGSDVFDANRPVHLFTLMIDSLTWGRNPVGYHLSDILLHALNTALLFIVLYDLLRLGHPARPAQTLIAATVGAVFFAVHPLNNEAVSGGSYREDLLVNVFVLLAWIATFGFAAASPRRRVAATAGCIVALLLAAGSKQSGFVGPFLLLLLPLLAIRVSVWRPWAITLGGAVAGIVIFWAFAHLGAAGDSRIVLSPASYPGGSFGKMLTLQPRLWALSLKHVVWPTGLSADYSLQSVAHIGLWPAVAVLAAVTVVAAVLATRNRVAALGVLWVAIAMAPTSNILPLFRPLADRFMYLPMIGVSILVGQLAAVCIARLTKRWMRAGLAALAAAGTVLLGNVTLQRQAVWADRVALWTDAYRKTGSFTSANNLGFAYYDRQEYTRAVVAFRLAVQYSAAAADAWAGLAVALEALGRAEDADAAFARAVEGDRRYADPDELMRALVWSRGQAEALHPIAERAQAAPDEVSR